MAVKKNRGTVLSLLKMLLNSLSWVRLLFHFCAAIIVAVLLFFAVKYFLDVYTRHGEELKVPDFSNLTVQEAEDLAAKHKIRVAVTDSVFLKRMRRGAVCRQSPAPGSHVKQDKLITLTINARNPKVVTMPDLVGLSMRQARAELLSRGLTLGSLIYEPDLATNNVLRQMINSVDIEPGATLVSESKVDLVLGLNSNECHTYVPDVTGLKQISAVSAINDHSLNVSALRFDSSVKDYDDSLNAMVWRQVPEPSDSVSVSMGSEVALYLTLDQYKIPVKPVEEEVVE